MDIFDMIVRMIVFLLICFGAVLCIIVAGYFISMALTDVREWWANCGISEGKGDD